MLTYFISITVCVCGCVQCYYLQFCVSETVCTYMCVYALHVCMYVCMYTGVHTGFFWGGVGGSSFTCQVELLRTTQALTHLKYMQHKNFFSRTVGVKFSGESQGHPLYEPLVYYQVYFLCADGHKKRMERCITGPGGCQRSLIVA